MSDATNKPNENFSFLDLPDDELAKFDPNNLPVAGAPSDETKDEVKDETKTEDTSADAGASGSSKEDEQGTGKEEVTGQEPGKEAAADGEADEQAADEDKAPAKDKKEEPAKDDDEDKPVKDEKKADDTYDYKAAYERLTAPFKANGKDIRVENVDEAIQLMQMGANYNKKMAGLKPSLTLLKLLENNGLLSEEKISYLIDLDKKVPDAINKLIKESGLDPMDLDPKKADGYKPSAKTVDPTEVELDAVMDEIQDSAAFPKTLDVVGKQWDKASRNLVAQHPQVLKVINQHIENGWFDKISTRVERDRLFGRLNGLSDLEAYRQVSDAMAAAGEFASTGRREEPSKPAVQVVTPDPEKAKKEEDVKRKKQAAGGSKPVASTATPQDFNPLAMPDSEFQKIQVGKY